MEVNIFDLSDIARIRKIAQKDKNFFEREAMKRKINRLESLLNKEQSVQGSVATELQSRHES